MSSHPDADAFMRSYLRQPTDLAARLVFADWLEETGTPWNTAWARYIRAKAGADVYPPGRRERLALEEEASAHAGEIRATLAVPVGLFLGYPKSLLQLLPGPNITVRLGDYEIPQAVIDAMPESVVRENHVLPLQVQQRTQIIASVDPTDADVLDKLAFILDKAIVTVRAEPADLLAAINRCYGQTEVETVECLLFTGPERPEPDWHPPPPDAAPISRLVQLLIREAIGMGCERIQFLPRPDRVSVLYRIRGTWVPRDEFPRRLLEPVRERIAQLAGLEVSRPPGRGEFRFDAHGTVYTVRVAVATRAAEPVIDLDIADELEIVH